VQLIEADTHRLWWK